MTVNRRLWLKQTSLTALGLGLALRNLANEEGLPRDFGSEKGLINLGSNENPYGISSQARRAIIDMLGEANRYQFNVTSLKSFQKTLADYYGFTEENILVTPGSGNALALIARYFNKGNLVTADPTFGVLPNTSKKAGAQVIEVPLTYDKVHDLPALLKAINSNTQLVYIVNPANPTSTIIKPAELKNFCEEASKKAVVVIDEAYIDFLNAPDNESMISMVDKNPNILVVRTFSKIHAMAGLRLGFVIGNPKLIKDLGQTYFNNTQICVSNLTLAAALASLKDENHRENCKKKNEEARTYTLQFLQKMNFRSIPSYTNFIFFSLGKYKGNFAEDMLAKNIILRSNSYADGNWCRVSVGTMEEMQVFTQTIKNTFSQNN